ncbi:MAG: polysaccharide lyase family 1 protein [Treponema sp.]|nr:polysaccharide lyase family 1 protein [Treponema sp.]
MIFTKRLLLAGLAALCSAVYAESVPLSAEPGLPVTTYGWADKAALKYASPKKITYIDDAAYPDMNKKSQAFIKAIGSSSAAFIVVSGDVDLSGGKVTDKDHSYFDAFDKASHQRLHEDIVYPVMSNKTIIGVNKARIMYGGLTIRNVQNVIIRNIEFWDAHGSTEYDTSASGHESSKASIDNVVIRDSKGVWIDHCTFSDGVCNDMTRNYNHDGLLDIPAGQYVTVSYCDFHNHDKVMLVGSGEKALDPAERSITLHHNYFHGTTQRTPRTRGTFMHIYNNVYDNIGVSGNSGYCLGPGTGAQFIVENNYFGSRLGAIVDFYDKSADSKATLKLYYAGNNEDLTKASAKLSNSKVKRPLEEYLVAEKPWSISYEYTMQPWNEAKDSVLENAGAGKTIVVAGKEYPAAK